MADRLKAECPACGSAETRNAIIEECAVAAEAQDRVGREWVENSLWDNICKRAGANVRKLKTEV